MFNLIDAFKHAVGRVESARGDWYRNANDKTHEAYEASMAALGRFVYANADAISKALEALEREDDRE